MSIRSGVSNKLIRGLLAGIAGVILTLILWASGLVDTWEAKSWDWRVGIMAKPGKATSDISLILLDQNSLDWGKGRKWLNLALAPGDLWGYRKLLQEKRCQSSCF